MSLPVYPSMLPTPERQDYGLEHVSPTRTTELATGRPLTRRVFRTVPTKVSVRWLFKTNAECAYFEAWFRDVLLDGTLEFMCPLKSPIGIKNYQCKFAGMYAGPALVGPVWWVVTASLVIFERPLLPAGWGTWPQQFILDLAILDRAINQDAP